MAGSRYERIGTIFSRVTGLLQSKALALEDRPLWFDVYKAFPPQQQPRYDRPSPDTSLRQIFYPEDTFRAKFHKRLGKSIPKINLEDNRNLSVSQRLIELISKLQNEKNLNTDEAFETAFDILKAEGVILDGSRSSVGIGRRAQRQKRDSSSDSFAGDSQSQSLSSSFKQSQIQQTSKPKTNIKLDNIFKDDS